MKFGLLIINSLVYCVRLLGRVYHHALAYSYKGKMRHCGNDVMIEQNCDGNWENVSCGSDVHIGNNNTVTENNDHETLDVTVQKAAKKVCKIPKQESDRKWRTATINDSPECTKHLWMKFAYPLN